MAQMVMADHTDSVAAQKTGKVLVPPDMLDHSVRDLDNQLRLFVRHPDRDMELINSG